MPQTGRSAQERWTERIGQSRELLTPSFFPDDAVALIYKPARFAMTSGQARTRGWKLQFEPRSPKFVEPLMGWTGSEDTLAQVELTFPSAQAAVTYARRQGLRYRLHRNRASSVRREAECACPAAAARMGRADARPGGDSQSMRVGEVPSLHYPDPQDVLADPKLPTAEKREVLRRWALEAYLNELALAPGNSVPHRSLIDEDVNGLNDLDSGDPGSATRSEALPPSHAPPRAA